MHRELFTRDFSCLMWMVVFLFFCVGRQHIDSWSLGIPLKWLDFSISTATSSHSWSSQQWSNILGLKAQNSNSSDIEEFGWSTYPWYKERFDLFPGCFPVGRLFKGYHHELLAGVWKTSLKETEPSGKRSEVNNSTGFNIFFCNCHLSPKLGEDCLVDLSQLCFKKKHGWIFLPGFPVPVETSSKQSSHQFRWHVTIQWRVPSVTLIAWI